MRKYLHMMILMMWVLGSSTTSAQQLTPVGAGGGGFIWSGAYHPTDDDVVLIGGDNSGIHRSEDYGLNWSVWNEGLVHKDEAPTFYVEDLTGLTWDAGGSSGFFAATRGGIFWRGTDASSAPWELLTPAVNYNYFDGTRNQALPFSCFDTDGGGNLYAGAGYSRFEFEEVDVSPQATVWAMPLSGQPTQGSWLAIPNTDFGSVRDISIEVLSNATWLAVATPGGVRLYNNHDLFWTTVDTSGGCWSVHLTPRGTLYAAFVNGAVRRIADVSTWNYTWDTVDLANPTTSNGPPPTCRAVSLVADLALLTVHDGVGSAPDILYLTGTPNGNDANAGLFRTELVGTSPVPANLKWKHWMYRQWNCQNCCDTTPSGFFFAKADTHGTGGNGTASPLDIGHIDEFGAWGRHRPIVSRADPDRVVFQTEGRLHVYDALADSFLQRYTIDQSPPSAAEWKGRGYNQQAVRRIDFADAPPGSQNGKLILAATGDFGIYRSTPADRDAFERVNPPLGTGTNQTPTYHAFNMRHEPISGATYVAYGGKNNPGLVFRCLDGNYTNITTATSLQAVGLTPANTTFGDMVFVTDKSMYLVYTEYGHALSSSNPADDDIDDNGVLEGTSQDGLVWTWTKRNNGLQSGAGNVHGEDFLMNNATGDIFLAASDRKIDGVDIRAGLYVYNTTTTSWETVLDQSTSPSVYQDFRSIAQSRDGETMYAGTRGRSVGTGAVLKCTLVYNSVTETYDVDCTDPDDWSSITTGNPFGFQVPFNMSWTTQQAADNLTHIEALAVSPFDNNTVFAGMFSFQTLPQEGLWVYNYRDSGVWGRYPAVDSLVGIGVFALEFHPSTASSVPLMIGTSGHEMYRTNVRKKPGISVVLPTTPRHDGAAPSLKIVGVSQPGTGQATLRLELSHSSPIVIDVFDVAGRRVDQIRVDAQAAGLREITWGGNDGSGRRMPSGVYFARIKALGLSLTTKVVLVR